MNENQAFEGAKLLFLHGHGRKKVIQFLNEQGVAGEEAEAMTTRAYHAVKEQIPERVAAEPDSGGFPSWLIYILILVLINILSAIFGWGFWIY